MLSPTLAVFESSLLTNSPLTGLIEAAASAEEASAFELLVGALGEAEGSSSCE
jgi:hypothetical protein